MPFFGLFKWLNYQSRAKVYMKRVKSILSLVFVIVLSTSGSCVSANDLSDGVGKISYNEIRSALNSAPAQVREGMTKDQMARFIGNLLVDMRIEKSAEASGVAENPDVKARIERAKRDVVVRAFIDRELEKLSSSQPDLTALAKERYATSKSSYAVPAAIRVAHILLKVNPENPETTDAKVRAKAESILQSLNNGKDFGELAREFSEDVGSAKLGGELPNWAEKGKLVPPFEDAAYALKPGEVSGLVLTRFGYHIIKLLEYREGSVRTFDEVKDQILQTLRKEYMATKRQEMVKPYLGTKPIVLDDATMDALRKP